MPLTPTNQLISQIRDDLADLRQSFHDHVVNDASAQAVMTTDLREVASGIRTIQVEARVLEEGRRADMALRGQIAKADQDRRTRVLALIAAASPIATGAISLLIILHR